MKKVLKTTQKNVYKVSPWTFYPVLKRFYQRNTQLTFTCSKSTIETLEKEVKYVQS